MRCTYGKGQKKGGRKGIQHVFTRELLLLFAHRQAFTRRLDDSNFILWSFQIRTRFFSGKIKHLPPRRVSAVGN